ncbi:hypothetical protein VTK26DRAFT_1665 [Humicola hyalothermophila]
MEFEVEQGQRLVRPKPHAAGNSLTFVSLATESSRGLGATRDRLIKNLKRRQNSFRRASRATPLRITGERTRQKPGVGVTLQRSYTTLRNPTHCDRERYRWSPVLPILAARSVNYPVLCPPYGVEHVGWRRSVGGPDVDGTPGSKANASGNRVGHVMFGDTLLEPDRISERGLMAATPRLDPTRRGPECQAARI